MPSRLTSLNAASSRIPGTGSGAGWATGGTRPRLLTRKTPSVDVPGSRATTRLLFPEKSKRSPASGVDVRYGFVQTDCDGMSIRALGSPCAGAVPPKVKNPLPSPASAFRSSSLEFGTTPRSATRMSFVGFALQKFPPAQISEKEPISAEEGLFKDASSGENVAAWSFPEPSPSKMVRLDEPGVTATT